MLIFTGDGQTTNAIILTDSMSLLQKVKSGMGSPDWNVSMVDTDPPSKIPVGVVPWTCRSEGKRPSRLTGEQSNPHNWLASQKILSVEKLETIPAGTKPRTSHH